MQAVGGVFGVAAAVGSSFGVHHRLGRLCLVSMGYLPLGVALGVVDCLDQPLGMLVSGLRLFPLVC